MMIALVIVLGLINLILWSELFYRQFFKRFYDITFASISLLIFSWLYVLIAVLVKVNLGSPIIFSQVRPGKKGADGNEKLFKLYKFRTMTDERDENGSLLPDARRITKFGRLLRSSSLDELPELINIVKGDMSLVGPRPLLVKYIDYYSEFERRRHEVRPGLTGLAQINGRNSIRSWEKRFQYDVEYVDHLSLKEDVFILFATIRKVLTSEDVVDPGLQDDFDVYRRKQGNEKDCNS